MRKILNAIRNLIVKQQNTEDLKSELLLRSRDVAHGEWKIKATTA